MPVQSAVELVSVLATQQFDDLKETPESDWLEFKGSPYQISTSLKDKWELAKDVAAFANGAGGNIVIGVTTEKHPHSIVDAAISCSLIPKSLIDADAYRKIIAAWVYPLVRGLDFKWFPPETSSDKGLFLVSIPPQDDTDKLFILRKMLDEEG